MQTLSRCTSKSLLCVLSLILVSAQAPHVQRRDNDFHIDPDPPILGEDITVEYSGFEDSCEYKIDDGKPIRVDLTKTKKFVIPKAALRGKRFVTIIAEGGERGRRVIRLPQK